MELLDGAWIFLAFILIFGISLMFGLYTRLGSGINNHPYAKRYSDAPGANSNRVSGPNGISSRGTR